MVDELGLDSGLDWVGWRAAFSNDQKIKTKWAELVSLVGLVSLVSLMPSAVLAFLSPDSSIVQKWTKILQFCQIHLFNVALGLNVFRAGRPP